MSNATLKRRIERSEVRVPRLRIVYFFIGSGSTYEAARAAHLEKYPEDAKIDLRAVSWRETSDRTSGSMTGHRHAPRI